MARYGQCRAGMIATTNDSNIWLVVTGTIFFILPYIGNNNNHNWLIFFGTMELLLTFQNSWEFHHPNWRTHIFSEGLKSPTRYAWDEFNVKTWYNPGMKIVGNKSIERCASQMIWLTLGQSRRSDQQLPQDPFFRITYSLQWSTGLTTLDPCTSNQMQDAPYQLLNALHMCAYGVGVLTCFMAAFVHYIYIVLMKLSLFFLFCCIYIYIHIVHN